jgi:RNA polymerase sigma-70 factor (ECF subfamily)
MENYTGSSNSLIKELHFQIAVYEDEVAYKKLFFLLFPALQNFAFSIVKQRQVAEEIASDVLINVWAQRQALLKIEDLKMYLFISARNAAIRKFRQEHKIKKISLDELKVEFISDYCSATDILHGSELRKEIHQALQQLPPRCKIIYKLAKEDKLPYKNIASLLGISIKTVDSQLVIAVKKITMAIRSFYRKEI